MEKTDSASGSESSASTQSSQYEPKSKKIQRERLMDKRIEDAFFAFAKAAGQERVRPNKPFETLVERVKQVKARSAGKLVDIMFQIMNPTSPELLKELTLKKISHDWSSTSNEHFEKLMKMAAHSYLKANDRHERMTVLKMIAPVVPFIQLQSYLPGISAYYYKLARLQAHSNFELHDTKHVCEKYDPAKVEMFLNFITR